MSAFKNTQEELSELAARFREGLLTTDEAARLSNLLARDPAALDLFARYSLLESLLEFEAGALQSGSAAGAPLAADQHTATEPSPLPVAPPPVPPSSPSPVLGFLGGLFGSAGGSPIMRLALWAAALLGSGLLILLVMLLTDRSVARLTAGVNCQWKDATTAPDKSGRIPPGRTLELTAGVAEITFDRGAKVLLEAPATFRVETDNSGYLEAGKLVAKVPEEALGFAIDAACANVVDLGTEFAVEVDRNGRGQAHVLSGKVVVEPHPATTAKPTEGKPVAKPTPPIKIELRQGEAAAMATNQQVRRMAAQPERFLTELPATFTFHNTGAGVRPGQPDPHWQIADTSTDADFKPRAAEVIRPDATIMDEYRKNLNSRLSNASQWISVSGDAPDVTARSTWTFRTTFDLAGFDPATARLEGEYFADDFVSEIRLNGKRVQEFAKGLFRVNALRIDEGFVNGRNTLEWVVVNRARKNSGPSPIALRVELQGYAKRK